MIPQPVASIFVIDGALVNVLRSDAGNRLLVSRRAYDKLEKGGGV